MKSNRKAAKDSETQNRNIKNRLAQMFAHMEGKARKGNGISIETENKSKKKRLKSRYEKQEYKSSKTGVHIHSIK